MLIIIIMLIYTLNWNVFPGGHKNHNIIQNSKLILTAGTEWVMGTHIP